MKKYNVKEFAKFFNVKKSAVYTWVSDGIIKSERERKGLRMLIVIPETEIDKIKQTFKL